MYDKVGFLKKQAEKSQNEGWWKVMKDDEGWWRRMKDNGFKLFGGFDLWQTDERMDICDYRVAFATENIEYF